MAAGGTTGMTHDLPLDSEVQPPAASMSLREPPLRRAGAVPYHCDIHPA